MRIDCITTRHIRSQSSRHKRTQRARVTLRVDGRLESVVVVGIIWIGVAPLAARLFARVRVAGVRRWHMTAQLIDWLVVRCHDDVCAQQVFAARQERTRCGFDAVRGGRRRRVVVGRVECSSRGCNSPPNHSAQRCDIHDIVTTRKIQTQINIISTWYWNSMNQRIQTKKQFFFSNNKINFFDFKRLLLIIFYIFTNFFRFDSLLLNVKKR